MPSSITLTEEDPTGISTPSAQKITIFTSDVSGRPVWKDSAGVVHDLAGLGPFAIVGELGATSGAGSVCIVTMPCDGEILQSNIDGNVAGNAVVNIYKAPLATPTVFTSIVAAAKPTLSGAQSATDSTLTGWTKTFLTGDRIKFVCESLTTIELVAVTLQAIRT